MGTRAIDPAWIRSHVRSRLLSAGVDVEGLNAPERRLRVRQEVLAVLTEERAILPASVVTDVVNQVSDEVVGLGPIERLLKDPEVSERILTTRGTRRRRPGTRLQARYRVVVVGDVMA